MNRPYGRTIWFNSYANYTRVFGNMGVWDHPGITGRVYMLIQKDIREVVRNRIDRMEITRGLGRLIMHENI